MRIQFTNCRNTHSNELTVPEYAHGQVVSDAGVTVYQYNGIVCGFVVTRVQPPRGEQVDRLHCSLAVAAPVTMQTVFTKRPSL